jgi:hypothetical protein
LIALGLTEAVHNATESVERVLLVLVVVLGSSGSDHKNKDENSARAFQTHPDRLSSSLFDGPRES